MTVSSAVSENNSSSNTASVIAQKKLQATVFGAYLNPLLEIHNNSSNSTILIQYEHLTSSWQSAMATLGKHNSTHTQYSSDNIASSSINSKAVREQLTQLHQSQLRAYRSAAQTALQEYAKNWILPKVDGNKVQYQQHCLQMAKPPNWNVPPNIKDTYCNQIVLQRAADKWNDEHKNKDDIVVIIDDDEAGSGEVEDGDNEQEESAEEGEEEEEDQDEEEAEEGEMEEGEDEDDGAGNDNDDDDEEEGEVEEGGEEEQGEVENLDNKKKKQAPVAVTKKLPKKKLLGKQPQQQNKNNKPRVVKGKATQQKNRAGAGATRRGGGGGGPRRGGGGGGPRGGRGGRGGGQK